MGLTRGEGSLSREPALPSEEPGKVLGQGPAYARMMEMP